MNYIISLTDFDKSVLDMEKNLSPIKLKKGESIKTVLPEIKEQISVINDTIDFFNRDETKKYICFTVVVNPRKRTCTICSI